MKKGSSRGWLLVFIVIVCLQQQPVDSKALRQTHNDEPSVWNLDLERGGKRRDVECDSQVRTLERTVLLTFQNLRPETMNTYRRAALQEAFLVAYNRLAEERCPEGSFRQIFSVTFVIDLPTRRRRLQSGRVENMLPAEILFSCNDGCSNDSELLTNDGGSATRHSDDRSHKCAPCEVTTPEVFASNYNEAVVEFEERYGLALGVVDAVTELVEATPAPITVAPATSSPVTPAPLTSRPTTRSQVASSLSPVTLAPMTSAPVTLASVAPAVIAPVTPAHVTHVTPDPITSSPITEQPVALSMITISYVVALRNGENGTIFKDLVGAMDSLATQVASQVSPPAARRRLAVNVDLPTTLINILDEECPSFISPLEECLNVLHSITLGVVGVDAESDTDEFRALLNQFVLDGFLQAFLEQTNPSSVAYIASGLSGPDKRPLAPSLEEAPGTNERQKCVYVDFDLETIQCSCREGWTGENGCFDDIRECDAGPCASPGGFCVEKSGDQGQYACGCESGWEPSGEENSHGPTSCRLVDQCEDNSCHSDASCTDSEVPGVFSCVCNDGFEGTGYQCTPDPNEEELENPEAEEPFSFIITCEMVTCPDKNICNDNPDGALCVCLPGFEGGNNGRSACKDRNECCVGCDNGCHQFADCANIPGSFFCVCQRGYVDAPGSLKQGTDCIPLNECSNPELNNCDPATEVCIDRPPPGATGGEGLEGFECTPITPSPTLPPTEQPVTPAPSPVPIPIPIPSPILRQTCTVQDAPCTQDSTTDSCCTGLSCQSSSDSTFACQTCITESIDCGSSEECCFNLTCLSDGSCGPCLEESMECSDDGDCCSDLTCKDNLCMNIAETTVVLNFNGEAPNFLPQRFFDNLEDRFLESFNTLNSLNVDHCDTLCREIFSVDAVLVVPPPTAVLPDQRRRLDDVGITPSFSFNFNVVFGCNGFCPSDNPLFGDDAGRRRLQSSSSSGIQRQLPPTCVCPANVTESRSPTEDEFTVELNARLSAVPSPSPTAVGAQPVTTLVVSLPIFTVTSTVEL